MASKSLRKHLCVGGLNPSSTFLCFNTRFFTEVGVICGPGHERRRRRGLNELFAAELHGVVMHARWMGGFGGTWHHNESGRFQRSCASLCCIGTPTISCKPDVDILGDVVDVLELGEVVVDVVALAGASRRNVPARIPHLSAHGPAGGMLRRSRNSALNPIVERLDVSVFMLGVM